ncbi:MAG: hypothetical protein K0R71_423 [Bacillales bacterium]|jgi:uncharacterized protein YnzC (UPF0291/DUF896 family)|nr:hypothetical protein [Bacillales bacterium]
MLSKEKINRINELARKSKAEGLNEAELLEQTNLRQEYLKSLRTSMTNTITNVKIIDPKGDDVTPQKIKDLRSTGKTH